MTIIRIAISVNMLVLLQDAQVSARQQLDATDFLIYWIKTLKPCSYCLCGIACSPGYFRCIVGGACLPSDAHCNRRCDCPYCTDELHCYNASQPSVTIPWVLTSPWGHVPTVTAWVQALSPSLRPTYPWASTTYRPMTNYSKFFLLINDNSLYTDTIEAQLK